MKLTSYTPSDEFEQSLRSALLERVGMIAKLLEKQSTDWEAIHKPSKEVMHKSMCMTFFICLYGILSASHRIESGIAG